VPGRDGVGRVAEADGAAVDLDGPALGAEEAGEHLEQLVLPLPFQRHDASTSPLWRSKDTSASLRPSLRDRTRRRGSVACRRRAARRGRTGGADGGAEHHLDDPLLDAGHDVDGADRLAVAQHVARSQSSAISVKRCEM
jgi:hypothetical protein